MQHLLHTPAGRPPNIKFSLLHLHIYIWYQNLCFGAMSFSFLNCLLMAENLPTQGCMYIYKSVFSISWLSEHIMNRQESDREALIITCCVGIWILLQGGGEVWWFSQWLPPHEVQEDSSLFLWMKVILPAEKGATWTPFKYTSWFWNQKQCSNLPVSSWKCKNNKNKNLLWKSSRYRLPHRKGLQHLGLLFPQISFPLSKRYIILLYFPQRLVTRDKLNHVHSSASCLSQAGSESLGEGEDESHRSHYALWNLINYVFLKPTVKSKSIPGRH